MVSGGKLVKQDTKSENSLVDLKQLEEQIIALEECLFTAEVRLSSQQIDALLSEDFKEITSTGRCFYKDEAVTRLPSENQPEIQAEKFQIQWLTKEIALLNYRSILKRDSGAVIYSLRSSIWRKEDSLWKMCFHQGTPCEAFKIE